MEGWSRESPNGSGSKGNLPTLALAALSITNVLVGATRLGSSEERNLGRDGKNRSSDVACEMLKMVLARNPWPIVFLTTDNKATRRRDLWTETHPTCTYTGG